ncbi:MAG: type II CAAX prenyl endopeptidase Rce1 family protein [Haloferacaceae archaeon]
MPSNRTAGLAGVLDRRPVAAFIALAFALSWGFWIPTFLAVSPGRVGKLVLAPGAFGPPVAAAVVAYGRGEFADWFQGVRRLRAPPRWYVAALAAPLALGAGVVAAAGASGAALTLDRLARVAPVLPASLLLTALLGGGQEELGWRGFALPHLQSRFGALSASVLLGAVWALWHLPLFVLESGLYADRSFLLYGPAVVCLSVLLTWAYNGSGGSVPVAVLLHGGVNAVQGVAFAGVALDTLPVPPTAPFLAASFAAALLVLARFGPRTLAPTDAVRAADAVAGADADVTSGADADVTSGADADVTSDVDADSPAAEADSDVDVGDSREVAT